LSPRKPPTQSASRSRNCSRIAGLRTKLNSETSDCGSSRCLRRLHFAAIIRSIDFGRLRCDLEELTVFRWAERTSELHAMRERTKRIRAGIPDQQPHLGIPLPRNGADHLEPQSPIAAIYCGGTVVSRRSMIAAGHLGKTTFAFFWAIWANKCNINSGPRHAGLGTSRRVL